MWDVQQFSWAQVFCDRGKLEIFLKSVTLQYIYSATKSRGQSQWADQSLEHGPEKLGLPRLGFDGLGPPELGVIVWPDTTLVIAWSQMCDEPA